MIYAGTNGGFLEAVDAGNWLAGATPVAVAAEHPRVIELDGTRNTRDIGGYPTAADGTLRWGQVIRSDNLSRLTDSDFGDLEAMGVRSRGGRGC